MKDDQIEDELDAIRLRHYELTKDMTPEERVAYVNSKAEQILKPYGIRLVHLPVVRWGDNSNTKSEMSL
ncbi:MAG: hypothetical protein LBC93_07325 [Synergistaceae bacterium]|jgi:hypothetical protein|nr:hypothetical protein [Synergistaceae bacterium]